MLLAAACGCASAFEFPGPSVRDVRGFAHHPLDPDAEQVGVVVFVSPWCPIVNSYAATLRRLREEFPKVALYLVHSDPDVSLELAREHAERYSLPGFVIRDTDQILRHALGASVTPEAFVIERGQTRYQGRIDNLYIDFGKRLVVATRHYLADALRDVAAGNPVALPAVPALGCDLPDLAP